jgi:hypothetical protein
VLTLQQCRKLVGADCDLSDNELEVAREQLYALAALTIDVVTDRKRTRLRLVSPKPSSLPAPSFMAALNLIENDQRNEIEERAAILEYDANLSRDEAERTAILLTLRSSDDKESYV